MAKALHLDGLGLLFNFRYSFGFLAWSYWGQKQGIITRRWNHSSFLAGCSIPWEDLLQRKARMGDNIEHPLRPATHLSSHTRAHTGRGRQDGKSEI